MYRGRGGSRGFNRRVRKTMNANRRGTERGGTRL